MARIPEEEISRLKSEVSLERLVSGSGVELKPHGSDLIGHCPFHDDREPSLVITPSKNLWHCLGACQTGGSVIDWVMKSQGVSFRHAVELLRSDFTPLAALPILSVKQTTIRKLPSPVSRDADDHELLRQVVSFYHGTLLKSPEALAYLEKRGLSSMEMIKRFKLGFADRTLGLRLPSKNRVEGAGLRGRMMKLGIYRESGHEHFTGSLVIPVFDEKENVTEMYGRKITPNLRPGTPLHLYLPGPHKGVWNLEALAASKEIILCEALIDALTFWSAGFRNVTAAYGVGGFTEDHLTAFKRYGTEKVLIAYDRDEAGEKGAETLARKLVDAGISCFRIQFPKGMDANDYALKVQPASKSLEILIRHAIWLGGVSKEIMTQPAALPLLNERIDPSETKIPSVGSVPENISLSPEPIIVEPPVVSESHTEPGPATDHPAHHSPLADIPVQIKPEEVIMTLGDRRYRIRGLNKNMSYDQLKINLLAAR